MRVWMKKNVEMEVKKGVKEGCLLVKIVGKNGEVKRYVMKEVEKFWGEEDERVEDVDW